MENLMKIPSTPEERHRLIEDMKRAVDAQIEFWDLATSITEMTDADPDVVFELLRRNRNHRGHWT